MRNKDEIIVEMQRVSMLLDSEAAFSINERDKLNRYMKKLGIELLSLRGKNDPAKETT